MCLQYDINDPGAEDHRRLLLIESQPLQQLHDVKHHNIVFLLHVHEIDQDLRAVKVENLLDVLNGNRHGVEHVRRFEGEVFVVVLDGDHS